MWIDDRILVNANQAFSLEVGSLKQTAVVLGRSNIAKEEVSISNCSELGIKIQKRLGGGGTVVLYPGCLIVSFGCWVRDRFENNYYFKTINEAIIASIQDVSPDHIDISQQGISDLCIGEKKFGGTSLFRSRNYLLYQASLIHSLNLDLIEKTLLHPSREPDYRGGRSHSDFLCGLKDHIPRMSIEEFEGKVATSIRKNIQEHLKEKMIDPVESQIRYIQDKVEST